MNVHAVMGSRKINGRIQSYIVGYRIGSRRDLAPRCHPLYFCFKSISQKRNIFTRMNENELSDGMKGVYGIFGVDEKGKEICLYIGQSMNLKRRLEQHANLIKQARQVIFKTGDDVSYKNLASHELPEMYFKMANYAIGMSPLYVMTSKQLADCASADKALHKPAFYMLNESLTILEQFAMDTFNPKLNAAPARMHT